MSERWLTPDQVIGSQVRRLRESSGLTQQELAVRLHKRGWGSRAQSSVAALERGDRRVDLDEQCLIASLFDIPPQALLVSNRSTPVRVAGIDRTPDEWHELVRVTKEDSQAFSRAIRTSIPELQHIKWTRRLNRQATKVLLASRELELADRSKYPGPTFVSDSRTSVYVTLPSWGVEDRIDLVPGEPHVARDRLEAEALIAAAHENRIRRIDRHEARRLRASAKGRGSRA